MRFRLRQTFVVVAGKVSDGSLERQRLRRWGRKGVSRGRTGDS
jgi:hypothetical protein